MTLLAGSLATVVFSTCLFLALLLIVICFNFKRREKLDENTPCWQDIDEFYKARVGAHYRPDQQEVIQHILESLERIEEKLSDTI